MPYVKEFVGCSCSHAYTTCIILQKVDDYFLPYVGRLIESVTGFYGLMVQVCICMRVHAQVRGMREEGILKYP
jgi:hypothetical protein